jgi:hypothetical protein
LVLGVILPSKFGAFVTLRRSLPFEDRIMYGLAGFRFTLTLIFPYDELVFFTAQVLGLGGEAAAGRNALFL